METGNTRATELKTHLKPGLVYRREDLTKWSNAVDRHLQQLQEEGTLQKVAAGLYYYPKQSVFGKVPPEDHALVRSFLKDERFLLTSPNDYNKLGVGTTQLYNKLVVYNHKRHGDITLGNRTFTFQRKPSFPRKVTPAFLLVDLVNNLDQVAEDRTDVLERVKQKAAEMNLAELKENVQNYGSVKTMRLLSPLFEDK